MGLKIRPYAYIGYVQAGNDDTGDDSPKEKTAHRFPGKRGVEYHYHTGGDDDAQNPPRGHTAHGDTLVIAALEHGGDGD